MVLTPFCEGRKMETQVETKNVMKDPDVSDALEKSTPEEIRAAIAELQEMLPPDPPIEGDMIIPYKINVPPSAGGGISHAGVMYVSGHTYNIPVSVARDLNEICQRNFAHEVSLKEPERVIGRRRLNQQAM
jgi:hypothetical protein